MLHFVLLQRSDLREPRWSTQPCLIGGVFIGRSSISFSFPRSGSIVRPPCTTFSALRSGSEFVAPDPVAAALVLACHVAAAPLHDHFTDLELAYVLFSVEGIAGKVVVDNLPKEVGESSARSARCP